MNRTRQVAHYAWKQSKGLTAQAGKSRLWLFCDMMRCYHKYLMWTNQYINEKFFLKTKEERDEIGKKYIESGKKRDAWQKDFRENRKFFIKYGNVKYEKASLRHKRNMAYAKRYNAGENFVVEYDVNISRQHYLDGSLIIGNNVLLSKHVTIDYSGDVYIGDNVKISDGVVIESHTHSGYTDPSMVGVKPKKESLIIEEGCVIGTKSVILESCHRIGRHSRIGAGSYVRFDVPPYAIITGNPAKIVGFSLNPEEMSLFEEQNYPIEKRLSKEEYSKRYKKYFSTKLKEINIYTKRSI